MYDYDWIYSFKRNISTIYGIVWKGNNCMFQVKVNKYALVKRSIFVVASLSIPKMVKHSRCS